MLRVAVTTAAGGDADLNGAAGGAAERIQWSCGWCSDVFNDFDIYVQLRGGGSNTDTAGGAVMTAAGIPGILDGAASALRISNEELRGVTTATIQRFRYVQLCGGDSSTYTAGGAVMTAAGALENS